ncbi:glycosyltransferase [Bradyrhizobium yuanmingense]|uniref:glycosyltransferase n=1 Tax=Bradyrhizobium yuanmingense TaxID=108015 RepID=UPI0023B92A6A|nr:glycosyltransferase [Bradyrhizobium yuanmingense]MDF0517591.1 glycosyltransferase [Bradyrhizobium yuanmingense]
MIQSGQMGGPNSERQGNPAREFERLKYCGSGYRVLVICNDGAYFLRHRLSVVTHLASLGVDVTVIAGGDPIRAEGIQGWNYIHVPIERFRFDPFGDARLMLRTARTIRAFKPHAVHLVTLKPAIFSGFVSIVSHFLHAYPKQVLITLPGLGRMMSPKAPGQRRYQIASALTLLAFRVLSRRDYVHFTFETRHDREFWTDRGIASERNSSLIEGAGVDPNLFYPLENARSGSTTKVLFASRLLKSKGLSTFLTVAHDLAHRSDVEFIVAGLPDDHDPDAISHRDLEQMTEIRFLGHVTDMPNLLRQCDVVCLPTRYGEGIPRILIEAAATGLASIASDHPGCREAVEDGVTGQILSAKSDTEMRRELSAAIVGYLENPDLLKKHKRAANQHFLSRPFNQPAIAERFTELLGMPAAPLSD